MTKEARLDDIADYIQYLSQVYDRIMETQPRVRVVGLGFSQGVATLVRWMALGGRRFDAAVFWAGSFPPDLDPIEAKEAFADTEVFALAGDDDPFLDSDVVQRSKSHLEALQIPVGWTRFKGGHTIPSDPLIALARDIETKVPIPSET